MFLNPKINLFVFNFSKDLIPKSISEKYYTYFNNVPGQLIKDPIDLINYSIQSINLPGLTYSPVEQPRRLGTKDMYRSSIHPRENFSKDLSITMKFTDGFLNYWIMYDLFKYYYEYSTKQLYLPDQRLEILNGDGNVIVNVKFKDLLFVSLSELSLSFSTNNPDILTFDVSMNYNDLEIVQMFNSAY